jgi:hypothetical protein
MGYPFFSWLNMIYHESSIYSAGTTCSCRFPNLLHPCCMMHSIVVPKAISTFPGKASAWNQHGTMPLSSIVYLWFLPVVFWKLRKSWEHAKICQDMPSCRCQRWWGFGRAKGSYGYGWGDFSWLNTQNHTESQITHMIKYDQICLLFFVFFECDFVIFWPSMLCICVMPRYVSILTLSNRSLRATELWVVAVTVHGDMRQQAKLKFAVRPPQAPVRA